MRKAWIYLLLILAAPLTVWSQQNNFITYSLESGLPQSTVYSIQQDTRGYLWIGTEGGGAARFDGTSFKTFTKNNGLSGNIVRNITEDRKGNIWFATNEGITVYNGTRFRIINHKNGLAGGKMLKLFEDSKGFIWACTDDGGLNRISLLPNDSISIKNITSNDGLTSDFIFDIKEDKFHRLWLATFYGGINILTFNGDKPEVRAFRKGQIPSDLITTIEQDTLGNMWFGTYDAGAFCIKRSSLTKEAPVVTVYDISSGLNDNTIWDILIDKKGDVWFGTNTSGAVRLSDPQGKKEITTFSSRNGLPGDMILSLHQDSEGNIWMGTSGSGLTRFQGERFVHYTENDGLPKTLVQSMTQDKTGTYWLATSGNGLIAMTLNNGKPSYKTYTTKDGLPDNFVKSLSLSKDGTLWVATEKGIAKFNGQRFKSYTDVDGLADNKVNAICVDHRGIVWCGTSAGVSRYDGKHILNLKKEQGLIESDVQCILEDKSGNIWFGILGGIARYNNNVLVTYDEAEGLDYKEVNTLAEDSKGNIWIGTAGGGLYVFNASTREKVSIKLAADEHTLSSNIIYSLCFQDAKTLLVGTNKGFDRVTLGDSLKVVKVSSYDKLDGFVGVENNQNSIYKDHEGNIWFGTIKGITRYSPAKDKPGSASPRVYITGVKLFFKDVDWKKKGSEVSSWFGVPQQLGLKHVDNNITFYFAGISYENPQKVSYRYMLEGLDETWSPPQHVADKNYPGLSPGDYTFKVVAIDVNGNISQPASYSFTINPPWYRTKWFYTLCIVLLAAGFYSFVKFREQKLKAEKKVLEDKVEERTREVVKQKEEIEEKNKDITDSINYAKRIQTAILPSTEMIGRELPDSFVLFKPKDIVSGDFYFFARTESADLPVYTIAAVDCTGHGVPGAFMSMIGNSILNQVIREKKITQPAEILNHLHEGVREALKQHEEGAQTRDGMDIALCTIDFSRNEVQYAGANRPLYVIRESGLEEIKADKYSIGGVQSEERRTFTNHTLQLTKGDSIYLSTDGYADQFGGEDGKKFMTKKFKTLLAEKHASTSMLQLMEILNTTIESWRGEHEQVDDICVIGFRI